MLSDSDSLPDYTARLRVLRSFLHKRSALSMELYNNGGRHVKDIEVARTLHYVSALIASVFPELD